MIMQLLTTHTVTAPYNFMPAFVETGFGLDPKQLVAIVCLASLPAVAGFCLLVLAH